MLVWVVAAVMEYSRLLVGHVVVECSSNITATGRLSNAQPLRASGYPRCVSTSETRWLTAGEQRAWREFVTACQTLFTAVEAQLQHGAGFPHGYYEILVRLSEAPGRALRMSQLAEASTSSKSRLSHAVARLEERGWIQRADCPTDRRGQVAQLTDQGFAALAEAAPGHVAQVRRSLIDVLTSEQLRQRLSCSDVSTSISD